MFFGRYEHSLDAKGRLMIPSRYRPLLGNEAYLTLGFDKNLILMTTEGFDKLSASVAMMSSTNPEARVLKRVLFGYGEILTLDKMGRILIPSFLRKTAKLENSAVIVGAGTSIEIWSNELWTPEEEEIDLALADGNRFADFNLPI